jgi:hypothetical protein
MMVSNGIYRGRARINDFATPAADKVDTNDASMHFPSLVAPATNEARRPVALFVGNSAWGGWLRTAGLFGCGADRLACVRVHAPRQVTLHPRCWKVLEQLLGTPGHAWAI